ncbi:MAG: hypothetical protein K9J12_01030 [Melioribacteraceae bacterium]|nr:hypothetical protein [Melioribacteraceae bacterium]MCF8432053.1 hypothetical protein [Melioribacteraceae bacterium]
MLLSNENFRLKLGNGEKKYNSDLKFEFHVAKEVRKKYEFDEEIFSLNGNVLFANFSAVRVFVNKINNKRDNANKVKNGEVNALGLLDEVYHFILREYENSVNPGVFKKAAKHLAEKIEDSNLNTILHEFNAIFPPQEIYHGRSTVLDYLNGMTGNRSNIEISIEEMMLLYFANFNPAAKKIKELFDENYFEKKDIYKNFVFELENFFRSEEKFGPDNQDIFTLFKTPILNNPDDIEAQLEYVLVKWKNIIGEEFVKRILSGKDLIKEDIRFESFGGGGAPTVVPSYKGFGSDADMLSLGKSGFKYGKLDFHYDEPEQFTDDIDWMPSVVLMAKNSYVWLDQLSKKYNREIKTLDQIPDEELDELSRWNFNGLWLIGIWERSAASKRIKHIMGNIDAVASAYSLFDYSIAQDLGGEAAYQNLNERAKARGIRLASDMVPNHTGIFSKWVLEHPEYFIQSDNPPFPGYSFTGEDLSLDHSMQIRIEDGYFRKSDAAVVFQRIDNRNGQVKYIYHGNDGTNMPWNDTAQLDMLKEEVREAVIQEIFSVARRFSIIRFDAAMTLAKKHFSRLWYPQPGTGGDIPSRADHAKTREEFDSFFPKEFWREVVDRINSEMPETLLLAEAFWLMEGYFVRTLGMHRVYNSAFMHMMMKEENEKYRDLITNTLEFEPEILKRYVNFMSNPDEETAIRQFGTDDKYFGVALMMITLPGLPMFAHGQIEGYTEKYGMEYKRAYYNETPKQWLVERHDREIFPLLRKRYLFSNVDNFWFFDVIDNYGNLNENVFAFTNRVGNERAVVFYNNRYDRSEGKIFHSTLKLVNENGNKVPRSITFAEALGVNTTDDHFYIYTEHFSGLEYLKTGRDIAENGYYLSLNGFQSQVLWKIREVYDTSGELYDLYSELNGQGVKSVQDELGRIRFKEIHEAMVGLFETNSIKEFNLLIGTDVEEKTEIEKNDLKHLLNKYYRILNLGAAHLGNGNDLSGKQTDFYNLLLNIKKVNLLLRKDFSPKRSLKYSGMNESIIVSSASNTRENSVLYLLWVTIRALQTISVDKKNGNIFNDLMLHIPIRKVMSILGKGDFEANKYSALFHSLINYYEDLFDIDQLELGDSDKKNKEKIKKFIVDSKSELITEMLEDDIVRAYCGVNYHENIWYFSKERFEELLNWMMTIKMLAIADTKDESKRNIQIEKTFDYVQYLKNVSMNSGYQLEDLRSKLHAVPTKIKMDSNTDKKGKTT